MIDKQKIRQILDDNSNDSGDNCREFTRAEIDKTIEDIYNLVSVPAETVVGQVSVSSANGETAGLTDEQIKLIKWFMRLAIELQECDYTTESVMSIDVEAWMNDYYENGLTSFQAIMEDESNA